MFALFAICGFIVAILAQNGYVAPPAPPPASAGYGSLASNDYQQGNSAPAQGLPSGYDQNYILYPSNKNYQQEYITTTQAYNSYEQERYTQPQKQYRSATPAYYGQHYQQSQGQYSSTTPSYYTQKYNQSPFLNTPSNFEIPTTGFSTDETWEEDMGAAMRRLRRAKNKKLRRFNKH